MQTSHLSGRRQGRRRTFGVADRRCSERAGIGRFVAARLVALLACVWLSIALVDSAAFAQEASVSLALRSDGPLTAASITSAMDALAGRRGEIAADSAPGSPKERLRDELDRRLALLGELQRIVVAQTALDSLLRELPARIRRLRAVSDAEANAPPPIVPVAPSAADVDSLRDNVVAQRREVETLHAELAEAARRAENFDTEITAQRRRRDRALNNVREAELAGTATATGDELEWRQLALENAKLEARLADEAIELAEREKAQATDLSEYRLLAAEVADQKLERLEVELELYRAARDAALAAEQAKRRLELTEKREAAATAASPVERVTAAWEAEIAAVSNLLPELEAFALALARIAEDQQARLEEDEATLARLRDYTAKYGTDGYTGEMIRSTFRSLAARRRANGDAVSDATAEQLVAYRARNVEVEQALLDLNNRWKREYDTAIAGLSAYEQASLRAKRFALRDGLRRTLNAEKASLDRIAASARELHALHAERNTVLDELDVFIRTRVLWIRDEPAVTPKTLAQAWTELLHAGAVVAAGAKEEAARIQARIRERPSRWLSVLFAGALSVLAWRMARTRRRVREAGRTTAEALDTVTDALVAVVPVPAVLVLLVGVLFWLDAGGTPILRALLLASALYLLLRGIGRATLEGGGLLQRFGWTSPAARGVLRRSWTLLLWAVAVCVLPATLLTAAQVDARALERVAWATFLVVAAAVAWRTFGVQSPCMDAVKTNRAISRRPAFVTLWRGALPLLVFAVPILDVVGYRFTASRLGAAELRSLVALVVLAVGYRLARTAFLARPWSDAARRPAPERLENGKRRLALLRVIFAASAIFVVARIWGIDQQGWHTLDAVVLYHVAPAADGGARFVTLANLITAAGVVLVTFWLLRHLPGIYDLALFPRMRVDTGLRYAIVTISRYGLFFLGILVALRQIRLDLTNIGWLVAAMGVGLGFGLQEIVSNFVSGLILLVERPVRVGDLVSVGSVTGRVQRINIRATTVSNADRQEVIVPNRELITQDVVNWTLADPISRLVLKIGVDYGSDPDAVRSCLLDVARADADVLADPPPQVLFMSHGESSLDFEVRVFLADPSLRMVVTDRLNTAINRMLDAKGIGIPFPQRDLHVRSWPIA